MEKKYIALILVMCLIFFFPSFRMFFTHDDFFFLQLAQISSVYEFFNFFNFVEAPEGFGFYRPLTTQVFYFVAHFFDLQSWPLHIISFVFFACIIVSVYQFVYLLYPRKLSGIFAAFLYSISATHFGHLYFLGTFHELGLGLFYLQSLIHFIKYLNTNRKRDYILSFLLFLAALASKEFAVTLPVACLLVWLFLKIERPELTLFNWKKLLVSVAGLLGITGIYLYLHFVHFGFAEGDSYVWDFSLRIFNTLFWYVLWSFNMPEMLLDYVGPGLYFNPHLFQFYASEIWPIFISFGLMILALSLLVWYLSKSIKEHWLVFIFCGAWFVVTLSPILFLPWHKFSYELTLPLVGVVFCLSVYIVRLQLPRWYIAVVSGLWFASSFFTMQLTYKTHWITQGSAIATRIHTYMVDRIEPASKIVVAFYDTPEDADLPWKPTEQVKVVLSGDDYFKVFWKDVVDVKYVDGYITLIDQSDPSSLYLRSREFVYVD